MQTGIYNIKNLLNNKCYIGSTEKVGFNKRWNKHKKDLLKNSHHSIKLQRAWNKYKENNFSFEVIEECFPEVCLGREQYYLDILKPEYDIYLKTGNAKGFKFSKSYCKKLKKIRRGKSNLFYGKHRSEVIINKLKEINSGKWIGRNNPKFGTGHLIKVENNPFFGKNHSEETKKKIFTFNKGRFVEKIHPNYKGEYIFYNKIYGKIICNQYDLIKKFNLRQEKISNICTEKRSKHFGWFCLGKLEK